MLRVRLCLRPRIASSNYYSSLCNNVNRLSVTCRRATMNVPTMWFNQVDKRTQTVPIAVVTDFNRQVIIHCSICVFVLRNYSLINVFAYSKRQWQSHVYNKIANTLSPVSIFVFVVFEFRYIDFMFLGFFLEYYNDFVWGAFRVFHAFVFLDNINPGFCSRAKGSLLTFAN